MANLQEDKDVREYIIKVAMNEFVRFGFKKTTMNDISRATNKARSSLYYYFSNKEEIFEAIVRKETQILTETISKAVGKERTAQGKLRSYIYVRMRFFQLKGHLYGRGINQYWENIDFIDKLRQDFDKQEFEMIKEILREGVKNGSFTIKETEATARSIAVAIKGLETYWLKEKDIKRSEKILDNLLEMFFKGLDKH